MRKNNFDSKLIIYKSRRLMLAIGMMVLFVFYALLFARNQVMQLPWMALVMPIVGAGLILLLVPMTEEWEYKPWQSKARRIEQQQK